MKVVVFYCLIVALSSSALVSNSIWNISKIFERYADLDTLITNKLFSLHNEKYNDTDLLRYICDQHKTFLSRNKFHNQPVRHNKISSSNKWIKFEKISTEIRIYYGNFLEIIETCDTLGFDDTFLNKFISSMAKQANVFFNSIKSTENLLYYSSNKTIRHKCWLTTESMNWKSLYHKIETTLLQTYILSKFTLLFMNIKIKDDNLMWPKALRVLFRDLEKIIFENFHNQFTYREDEGIRRCVRKNSITPKWFHRFNRQVYVSLREAASDIEQNMIVVGIRFLKQPNENLVHLQIRQAKVSVGGSIIAGTDHWKPVNFFSIQDTEKNIDYFKVEVPCLLIPTDIRREFPFIVTGLKLSKKLNNIVLMARFNELDTEKGTVDGSISDTWQYGFDVGERLSHCTYNHSSPFLDMRPISSKPLKPLSGVGISKRIYKPVTSPKLFPIL